MIDLDGAIKALSANGLKVESIDDGLWRIANAQGAAINRTTKGIRLFAHVMNTYSDAKEKKND